MDSEQLSATIERCSRKVNSIAKNIVNTNENLTNIGCKLPDETKELLNRCRSLVENYSHYMEQVSLHETTMEKFKSNYDFSENDLEQDIIEYEKYLKSESKKLKKKTKHPLLQEYDNIFASLENLNDSELITTEETQNYVDPITKKPIENPVRNKVCKHVYEKSSITTFITNNPRTRCPFVGCGNRNFINLTDLHDDKDLLTQLSNLSDQLLSKDSWKFSGINKK